MGLFQPFGLAFVNSLLYFKSVNEKIYTQTKMFLIAFSGEIEFLYELQYFRTFHISMCIMEILQQPFFLLGIHVFSQLNNYILQTYINQK